MIGLWGRYAATNKPFPSSVLLQNSFSLNPSLSHSPITSARPRSLASGKSLPIHTRANTLTPSLRSCPRIRKTLSAHAAQRRPLMLHLRRKRRGARSAILGLTSPQHRPCRELRCVCVYRHHINTLWTRSCSQRRHVCSDINPIRFAVSPEPQIDLLIRLHCTAHCCLSNGFTVILSTF